MKTSELTGAALNLAVAHCVEQSKPFPIYCDGKPMSKGDYTTDWAQGGLIIEREQISIWARGSEWAAESFVHNHQGLESVGPTPLIAAMRCYVASKLGDEIELPEELNQ